MGTSNVHHLCDVLIKHSTNVYATDYIFATGGVDLCYLKHCDKDT